VAARIFVAMGGSEDNATAERVLRREATTDRWWMNQMSAIRKISAQLRKEIDYEESSEGRLKELRKLKRQRELASSWLKERRLVFKSSPVRESGGEGMLTESEGLNRQELRIDVRSL
jgi:hypothetical protein